MKAAPFEYSRPANVAEACALLAADAGARVIAGGQTLVPLMAMRLARPTRLVDISRLAELAFVRKQNGAIVIGAATRQCMVEHHPLIAARLPLLAKVMPWVGHAAIRARGTIGGSLANADPSAEIALVAVTLDAKLHCRDTTKAVEIEARDFFLGPMTTALSAGACLTEVRFPVWDGRIGVGFQEVSARRSDFAFAAAAAQAELDDSGICRRLALAIGAATAFPLRLGAAEQALAGTRLEPGAVRSAVNDAMAAVETMSDLHASAAYRRRAAAALAVRAIAEARAAANRGAA